MATSNQIPVPLRKSVRIKLVNGLPTVDSDAVELWSTKGEQIEWISDHDFVICFPHDSPFESRHFYPGSPTSGKIKHGATGRYKYSVEIGGKILDPTIIVRP